jgi:predicted transcriptional regulator
MHSEEAAMGANVSLSFRTDHETAASLDRLVGATDRPRSWHLEQALKAYVKAQTWQVEDILRGVAEADAGDFADDAEIEAIYASFGEPLQTGSR